MPRYEVRSEAQDGSGHFRLTYPEAASKDEARAIVQRKEFQLAAYQLSDEQEADLCERYGVAAIGELPRPAKRDASDEEKAPFRALAAQDRARLNAHYQAEPYKVVSVTAVKK